MNDKKNNVGRPKFKVTPELRKQVESMSGMGLPQENIAAVCNCSVDTLFKYFPEELALGKAKANAKIAQCLFNKATGGDTTALIFWAKTQLGWKETARTEIAGAVEFSEAKTKLFANIENFNK